MHYQQKPTIVTALQLTDGITYDTIKSFLMIDFTASHVIDGDTVNALFFDTTSERVSVAISDWVVKSGEVYSVCDADTFTATYDAVEG